MAKDKIRILYYGDAPTIATGFGVVSKNILTNLYKTGKYEITILGVNYWGDPHNYPFAIYPIGIGSNDPYGRQRAFDLMKGLDFDILLCVQDSFILESLAKRLPVLKQQKKFTSICYFPIDGVPKASWIEAMANFDKCFTYTEYGKEECIKAFPPIKSKLSVIPHGAEIKDFHPASTNDIVSFRSQYYGPNASKFIITNVNRNQQRKDIPRTMMIFKEFKKFRPNSFLYLHMSPTDQGGPLLEVAKAVGLKLNEDFSMPANFNPKDGYYPVNVLNLIYNASDVVMSSTLGEGHGLAQTEAMAAKTPVLSPRNTACQELIGEKEERGYLIDSGHTPDHFVVLPHDNEVVRPICSVMNGVEKLIHIYDNYKEAQAKADLAYKWIHSTLQWDRHIVPKWDNVISSSILEMVKTQSVSSSFISAEEI